MILRVINIVNLFLKEWIFLNFLLLFNGEKSVTRETPYVGGFKEVVMKVCVSYFVSFRCRR